MLYLKITINLFFYTFCLFFILQATTRAGVVEVRVSTSHDDAEQRASGRVSRGDGDLDMVEDKGKLQTVGIRFPGLEIPRGAAITQAWIQFAADEADAAETFLIIEGEDTDNAKTFKTTRYSISSRPKTENSTTWEPAPWNFVGEAGPDQRTPDLSMIVSEIVSRPGWNMGNALVMIISGSGERVAESFNGNADLAPLLHVEFGGGVNSAPNVDAGADVTLTLPQTSVQLDGTVSDDGLPSSALTTSWSHVGGTGGGSVIFADIDAVDTQVTFSGDPGTYQLRLTADDGELTSSDDLVVQIYEQGISPAISAISQVSYFDTGFDASGNPLTIPSIDPAGVAVDDLTGHLMIADSEINEVAEVWNEVGRNIFETTLSGATLHGAYDVTPRSNGLLGNKEPTGIAYCASDGYYYMSNDDNDLIYRYAFAGSGFNLVDQVSTRPASYDPEGITCDPDTGKIYVAGGDDINILVYHYDQGFVLDQVIDINAAAGSSEGIASNPEGIAFDATSGHLFVMSNDDDAIFEYTSAGLFLSKYSIHGFSPRPKQPQGLAIGPSSAGNGKQSFYITDPMVDNNHDASERDGRIFEAEITR